MAMASLNASLLAPKGGAQPAVTAPSLVPIKNPSVPNGTGRFISNGRIAQRDQRAVGPKKKTDRKTKKKSLRLSASMDKDLRLLAVRNGLSQQALLEQAVSDYLDRAYASGECVCRR